jgi:hypothetical protein
MRRLISLITAGLLAFALSAAASAQEDLDRGKTGAQLFASDCAICHKTPQAVVKGGPPGEGFLRQHYTASQAAAASVAAYLRGIKPPVSAEPRGRKPKSAAKPNSDKEAKPSGGKPAKGAKQAQPTEAKPAAETKPAEKGSDAKAGESKAPEQKDETKKPE